MACLTYKGIDRIFFQQDEWLGLGKAITRREMGGLSVVIGDLLAAREGVYRFLPLTLISNYFIFNLFGLNITRYAGLAFILLILNASLVYLIGESLTKSSVAGVLVSLLWMTNSSASQGVTWISTLVPTEFSLLFFLISFYLFIQYFKKNNWWWLLGSLLFMFISLWFKEIGVYYIVVYILFIWMLTKKLALRKRVQLSVLVLVPIVLSVFIPRLFISSTKGVASSVKPNQQSIQNIAYNSFLLPARGLYQVFVPYSSSYEQIRYAGSIHYPEADGGVIENLVADSYLLLISFWIMFVVFLISIYSKKRHQDLIVFVLISFFASMTPFIFLENKIAFIEQRFFVHAAIWSSLLIVVCAYGIYDRLPKFKNLLLIITIAPLLFLNIRNIREKMDKDIYVGNYRRKILATVSEVEPKLNKDNIFYFYTDDNGFYEFQSGFGQTLGVWFYNTGKVPLPILTDQNFWDSSYEGIKQYPDGSYGYFMTYEKLLGTLENENELGPENVHAFYWDPYNHTVADVTPTIREKITNDISP